MVGVLQTFALFNSLEKVERKGFDKRRGEGKGIRTGEVCGLLQVNVDPFLMWRTYAGHFRAL